MPQEIPRQTSTPHPIQYNKENINEPSSFESSDSKSRMLLINFPSGKIVNEPGEKVKTFSSAMMINKRTKPYIITKKIVYESCAIGCKWNMIYK